MQQNTTEDTWQQQVDSRRQECGWKAVHINPAKVPIRGNRLATEQEWRLDFLRNLPGCIDASVRHPWELDEMTLLLDRN